TRQSPWPLWTVAQAHTRSGSAQPSLRNVPSLARSEGEGHWSGVRSGVKTRENHAEETTCQGEDALAWAIQMSRVACRVGGAARSRHATAPPSIVSLRHPVVRETHCLWSARLMPDGLQQSAPGCQRLSEGDAWW